LHLLAALPHNRLSKTQSQRRLSSFSVILQIHYWEITRYVNVDDLYVNPGKDFRILINTVAGGAWCDVIARMDVQTGQRYTIIADGDVHIGVNKCSAKLYTLTEDGSGKKAYVESTFKEYLECNK
jgi:hypothetical protein